MHTLNTNPANSDLPETTIEQASVEISAIIGKISPKKIIQYLAERKFSNSQIMEIILDTYVIEIDKLVKFFTEAGWTLEETVIAYKQYSELQDADSLSLADIAMNLKDEGLSIIEIIQLLQKAGLDDLKKIAMALNGLPYYDEGAGYKTKEIERALEGMKVPDQEIQKIMEEISNSIREEI